MNHIIYLLAGLGVLLIGFKLLSENIEKMANARIKKIFSKAPKNPFIGIGIGCLTTMLIQSSAATTIMVVGFVNAGLISLVQATAIIMGANIGTTITAQIVALGSFDISLYLMLFATIGAILAMFCKKDSLKTLGLSLAGLGFVFVGLMVMQEGMNPIVQTESVRNFLSTLSNPFLLLLIGIAFTALLQSSSAVTSIIIVMVGAGAESVLKGNAALYLVLGSNIGTCITALLSSIGTKTNAKRAAIIHLLFNVLGVIIFFVILLIFPEFNEKVLQRLFSNPSTQIAMFHTFFNVTATIIFLPFINMFVKLSTLIIPNKNEKQIVNYLDERFLLSTSIALDQANKETLHLGEVSMKALMDSIDSFINRSLKNEDSIREAIEDTDTINKAILSYLLKISTHSMTESEERHVSSLHRILIDLSREAELADNLLKYTKKELNEDLHFSEAALDGIKELQSKLKDLYVYVEKSFSGLDKKSLKESEAIEDQIDKLRSSLIKSHIKRLEDGDCSPTLNSIFINLVSNLERAGDHLDYVIHILTEEGK